jgi:DNA polymerase III delta subunit
VAKTASPALPALALPRRLAEGLPPVVVLAGADAWLRAEGLRAVLARALPHGDAGGSVTRIDARRAEDAAAVAAALDDLATPTLFGGGKVVAIENAEAATGPWHRDKRRNAVTALALAGLERPLGGHVLVLSTSLPLRGTGAVSLDAAAKAGALVADCRALYDAPGPWERARPPHDHELARFLSERMREAHGKSLSTADAHLLSRLSGSDLGPLVDALRTLALYVGARPAVSASDVEAVVGSGRTDPAWKVTDAVLDRDLRGALDLVAQAFDHGLVDGRGGATTEAHGVNAILTASLHRQWLKALVGAEALARGDDPGTVAGQAGVPPFQADAFLRRCRRDPGDLLRRHGAFLDAEAGVKGGGVPPRLALERLVIALAG